MNFLWGHVRCFICVLGVLCIAGASSSSAQNAPDLLLAFSQLAPPALVSQTEAEKIEADAPPREKIGQWARSQRQQLGRTSGSEEALLASLGERMNANTIAIVSGNLNATYATIAYDMSAVLDEGDKLRILPIIGKGGGQNIRDVRFLKGVDLGITQSNLLNYFRRSNELGKIDDKITYIAKLFNEEMHLVVRADSGITSISQLEGKRVNFSDIGSGTQLSTRDIFERLGIKPIEENMGQADAFEKLKSGELAATILIAGKPTASSVKLKASEGFRLLPVPYTKPLQNDYLPAEFTHKDYPNLIEAGQRVETIAVGAVLIAYNWPRDTERYRNIEKFVNAFFPQIAEFQKPPRHPKWRETNIAAVLPGWTRFPAAEEWLQRASKNQDNNRGEFNRFLSGRRSLSRQISQEEREKLFREFLNWSQARDHQQ